MSVSEGKVAHYYVWPRTGNAQWWSSYWTREVGSIWFPIFLGALPPTLMSDLATTDAHVPVRVTPHHIYNKFKIKKKVMFSPVSHNFREYTFSLPVPCFSPDCIFHHLLAKLSCIVLHFKVSINPVTLFDFWARLSSRWLPPNTLVLYRGSTYNQTGSVFYELNRPPSKMQFIINSQQRRGKTNLRSKCHTFHNQSR